MRTFAVLVQQGRAATGLSHQRIAELVGRAPSTIRGWEWGRSEPTDPEVVMALAAVLDLPEDELLESVGLSRPSGSLGGSFADLAPADVGPDEVVADQGVEASTAGGTSADEDVPPEAGEGEEARSGFAESDRAAGGTDAVSSVAAAKSEAPEIVEQAPDEGAEQQRDSRAMPESTPRVVRAETHRTSIPPQPLLVPPAQRSYLEDQRQMTTYRVRAFLTFAILVVLLLLVEWGLHGATHSLKDALSGLHP
jgi:transcriptional regulator with XRE-family HTH domain